MKVSRPAQGLASLGVIVVWLIAASLVVLYANRALIFEQRASANQMRSTQAFEAAEAGVEWTLALLSHPGPIDSQCQPTDADGARTFRERLIQVDASNGQVSTGPAQAGCIRRDGGGGGGEWQCSCPDQGSATWPGAEPVASAFAVKIEAGPQAGSFNLVASGCVNATTACASGASDAQARIGIAVASLPLLARPPSATVIAGASIELNAGTMLTHTDATAGGVTAVAGTTLSLDPTVQLISLPGRPGAASVVANDTTLQNISLFTRVLGLAPATYRDLPAVKVLDCGGGCRSQDVSTAWAAGRQPVLWVDGSLTLDADVPLGRADAPLLLIVDGPLRLTGAQQPWGLVVARSVTWSHTGSGMARLRGALVTQDDVSLSGAQVMYDPDVLRRLSQWGTFVRVPGAWHDFER